MFPPEALSDQQNTFNKINQQNLIVANPGLSYEDVLNDDFQFNMDAHDVMVFLHIQKTGGTSFGRHLVRDLDLKVSIFFFVFLFFNHVMYSPIIFFIICH